MKEEFYKKWMISLGKPRHPLTREKAKKLHATNGKCTWLCLKRGKHRSLLYEWSSEHGTAPSSISMKTEGKRCSKPTRKCTTCTTKQELVFRKGLTTRSFLRNRQEKYFDKEGWNGWLYEISGKYKRSYHSWSGGVLEREEGIERVDKLIKDKPEFGNYLGLCCRRRVGHSFIIYPPIAEGFVVFLSYKNGCLRSSVVEWWSGGSIHL